MVYKWLKYTLSSFWPQHCYVCRQTIAGNGICTACDLDLPRITHGCARCGLSLPDTADVVCAMCLRKAPPYDRVQSALAYAAPVAHMVTGLKFHNHLHYAPLFAQLLYRRIADGPTQVEAVIPVPLHPKRLRERGFNQALEIARPLAAALGLPLLTHSLVRIRETAPQSLQAESDRQRNVHRAFALAATPGYRHIALVDDVMTSGHTVSEAAKCLRAGGAKTIEVWCVARATPDGPR